MQGAFRRGSLPSKTAAVMFSAVLAFGMTPISALAETSAGGGDNASAQQTATATASESTQVSDFASLKAALDSGATDVTLGADIEAPSDGSLEVPAGATVNTAGHTVLVKAGTLKVAGSGSIVNGEASDGSSTHCVFSVAEGASLELGALTVRTAGYAALNVEGSAVADGTAIECTASAEQLTAYDAAPLVRVSGANATFAMPAGSIAMGKASAADCGLYGIADLAGAKVVLGDASTHEGPTVHSNSPAVGGNNLDGPMDLTINGGSYSSDMTSSDGDYRFDTVLYVPADASVAITGGELSGNHYALSMPYANTDVALTVTGGTLSGSAAAVWAGDLVGRGGANAGDDYEVTGGSFSSDPTAFLADGYAAVRNADGAYGVEPVKDEATIERLAGDYAADTAAAVAARAFEGDSADTVVISRDDDYFDALSGAGLAGALNAPILLTRPNELSAACMDEIEALGATKAVVLGGTSAVSDDVVASLEAKGVSVERVWGDDAYGTSLAVSQKLVNELGGNAQYAVAVNPTNFADAVSISGWAYRNKVPVMLQTWGDTAADRGYTDEALQILTGRTVIVCGGTSAVSDESVAGLSTVRLGGETLYDTSRAIANWEIAEGGMSAADVSIASAAEPLKGVDALAASALAGRNGGVVLLAQSNPEYYPPVATDVALSFITSCKDEIEAVHVLGGTSASTEEFYGAIKEAMGL